SSPPTAGPAITPNCEQVTDGPRRLPSASGSIVDSQARPVVHTTPKAIPNPVRPISNSGSEGAAWARHDTDSTAPAARVTRRAPKRSAASPAGTDTTSVARPG